MESLRKEAKSWLKAVRAGDPDARARLARAYPGAPSDPGLRDLQHALALERGFAGWTALLAGVDRPDEPLRELLRAASSGDAARVAALADAHPQLVSERGLLPGHNGLRTALHYGVGHEPVVRALVERGANPNIRDEGDYAMPLHFAAERQDLPVIRLLIEHGADPIGTGDYHELDVIGWACAWDYLTAKPEVVDYLLTHGARHNMSSAVAMGDVESVRALAGRSPADLERRMDLTNRRRMPLHLAVVKKQPAVLEALLALGANTEALDEAGFTALDQAAVQGETAMAQTLIDSGADVRLPAAVALGRTRDVDRLLRQDPDALKPGHSWGTLIVRAAERAPGEVIELLIRRGASVDVWDNPKTAVDATSQYTPLHAAATGNNVSAAAVLIKHGANPAIREHRYCATPAGWAAYFKHAAVRDVILQGPIDLFEALAFDLTDRIPTIVARDAGALNRPFRDYASCQPRDGQWWPEPWVTPIVWAVANGKADAVRVLLALGAERTAAPDGRTLEDIAIASEHGAIAEVLRTWARR